MHGHSMDIEKIVKMWGLFFLNQNINIISIPNTRFNRIAVTWFTFVYVKIVNQLQLFRGFVFLPTMFHFVDVVSCIKKKRTLSCKLPLGHNIIRLHYCFLTEAIRSWFHRQHHRCVLTLPRGQRRVSPRCGIFIG